MQPDVFFIALILLRLAAIFILARVIRIQLKWINVRDTKEYTRTRRSMFGLTSLALLANFLPLILDIAIAMNPQYLTFSELLLVLSSNAVGDLLQAILICKLYKEN